MTLSEISRYWAAKKLTEVKLNKKEILMNAPFSTKEFTIQVDKKIRGANLVTESETKSLKKKVSSLEIENWNFYAGKKQSILCFTLPKGESKIILN